MAAGGASGSEDRELITAITVRVGGGDKTVSAVR